MLKGVLSRTLHLRPEGCGKTRLLRELTDRVRRREDYLAIYVDAQSTGGLEEALAEPQELVRYLSAVVEGLGRHVVG